MESEGTTSQTLGNDVGNAILAQLDFLDREIKMIQSNIGIMKDDMASIKGDLGSMKGDMIRIKAGVSRLCPPKPP